MKLVTQCPQCGSRELATRGEANVTIYETYTADGRTKDSVTVVDAVTATFGQYCRKCDWEQND